MKTVSSKSADLELRIVPYGNAYGLTLRFSRLEDAADIQRGPFPVFLDFEKLRALEINPSAYGESLSAFLFAEPLSVSSFAEARAAALSGGYQLRLRLLLPQELQILRWEMLNDPRSKQPLSLENDLLLSRYLSADDYQRIVLPDAKQISSLIAVAAPVNSERYGMSAIDSFAEVSRAKVSLESISTSVLGSDTTCPVTWQSLTEKLRFGYDILYLVAHGVMREGISYLYLTDDELQLAPRSGADLASLVRNLGERRPRLVVLSSCESAGNGYADSLAALGPQLAQAGVPAVLAMQGKVSMKTAENFMTVFFQEVLRDGYADRAVAAARLAVIDHHDWWMPVLYSRLRTGRIWNQKAFEQGEPPMVSLGGDKLQISHLSSEEHDHIMELIAEKKGLMRQLELQEARFGLYCPPHVKTELRSLKREIAELEKKLGVRD